MTIYRSDSNKYKILISDIFIFLLGTVLSKAIQFFLMPLYTTYMSPEAYGVAELTNNLSEFFFPIVTLCIYEAAFRFAVDPYFNNSNLVTAVIKVMIFSSFIGFIIALITRFVFKYSYSFYLYFILYSYSIRMCAAYYVRGNGLSKIFALSGIINAFSLGVFNSLFIVFLHLNERGYLLSIGLSYCISACFLFIFGKIAKDYKRNLDSSKDLFILFKYCLPLIFYNVLYWFTTISGRYILLLFTDTSTAGKYVAAIKIAAVVNMIQQAVYAAFQLNSSREFTENDKEIYYTKTTNFLISIYCFFGSLIISTTPVLAKFTLKYDFYDAKVYLPIIMLSAIINCVSSVIGTMYSTYKKTRRVIGVSLFGALINVGAGILFTPVINVWGVCIASVLCYFSQTIYKLIDVKTFCNISYNWGIIIGNLFLLIIQVVVISLAIPYNWFISIFIVFTIFLVNKKILFDTVKQFLR